MKKIEDIHDPVEHEFWLGASRGQLLLRHCDQCQRPHWYPRPICPHCGHRHTRFEVASGEGHIHSMTRLHAKGQAPRCVAYITLKEGVTLVSNVIEDTTPARIGQAVRVSFMNTPDGPTLPVFVPVEP